MRCPMLQNFKENLTCMDEQLLEQQMLKSKCKLGIIIKFKFLSLWFQEYQNK